MFHSFRIGVQNSLFDKRFRQLPMPVQMNLLSVHKMHESKQSWEATEENVRRLDSSLPDAATDGLLSNTGSRESNAHTLTMDLSGTLVLKNKHQRWKMLTSVAICVQILSAVTTLHVRPFGVGPTTWTMPSISFLCDRPTNMTTFLRNNTLRSKLLSCDDSSTSQSNFF